MCCREHWLQSTGVAKCSSHFQEWTKGNKLLSLAVQRKSTAWAVRQRCPAGCVHSERSPPAPGLPPSPHPLLHSAQMHLLDFPVVLKANVTLAPKTTFVQKTCQGWKEGWFCAPTISSCHWVWCKFKQLLGWSELGSGRKTVKWLLVLSFSSFTPFPKLFCVAVQ